MSSAPYHLSICGARADALFASPLQRSYDPSAGQVRQAIATAIGAYGARGCAARDLRTTPYPAPAVPRDATASGAARRASPRSATADLASARAIRDEELATLPR